MKRVMGIDPGTHRVGWGIIEGTAGKQTSLASGCIESPRGTAPQEYLITIESKISTLIAEYHPEIIGLETLLFQKNVSTAMTVAQARGVIILCAAKNNIHVLELAPNTIKSAVTGSGSAGKVDVERMVGLLLGIDTKPLLDDTTDALAIAISAMVTHIR